MGDGLQWLVSRKPKILELSFIFIALPWPFDNQWFFEDSVIVHLCQVDLLRIPNEEHEAKSLSEYACLLNFAYSTESLVLTSRESEYTPE